MIRCGIDLPDGFIDGGGWLKVGVELVGEEAGGGAAEVIWGENSR